MAQLNPAFELDTSDINSYEQIQLLNDARIARQSLARNEPYNEPADNDAIKNNFSSFTFVDFCPRFLGADLISSSNLNSNTTNSSNEQQTNQNNNQPQTNRRLLRCHELEGLSELFERANAWLKQNASWRVISAETLTYDSLTHFKLFKSAACNDSKLLAPQNTRGLRLWLAPSKSRFSGPQRIGCINVVPREVDDSLRDGINKNEETQEQDTCRRRLETIDEMVERLNELLKSRPLLGEFDKLT